MVSQDHERIVAFDLDGTAIESSPGARPSERLSSSVRQLQQDKNYTMTPVTSRPLAYCHEILEDFELTGLAVVAGGAQIYDMKKGKVVDEELLQDTTGELANTLIGESKDRECFVGDTTFSDGELLRVDSIDFDEGVSGVYFLDVQEEQIAKNIVYTIRKLHRERKFPVQSLYIDTMVPGRNGYDVHIHSNLATKGEGLNKVLKRFDMDPQQIIAIGDSWNDMPMLDMAGVKVVMENADPRIKNVFGEQARVIGSVAEDGLAEYFEELLKTNPTC